MTKLDYKNIFELQIADSPERKKYPKLDKIPKIDWNNSYRQVFQALYNNSFIRFVPMNIYEKPIMNPYEKHLSINDLGLRFNIENWKKGKLRPIPQIWDEGAPQDVYVKNVGVRQIKVHILLAHLEKTQRAQKLSKSDIDDRSIFLQNKSAAQPYIDELKNVVDVRNTILGLRLIFLKGYSHFSITYSLTFPYDPEYHVIVRKYVLTFTHPTTKRDVEVVITAGFENEKNYSLIDFLTYSPIFGHFVYSSEDTLIK